MKRFRFAIIAFMTIMPAMAQMDNVVEVENTYTPHVKDANKINVVPEKRIVNVTRKKVNYTSSAHPMASDFVFQPLSLEQTDVLVTDQKKNFVTAGGGNMGNLLIGGAFGLDFTKYDRLDIDLGLNGYNGNTAEQNTSGFGTEKWKSRFYTTQGKLSYTHALTTRSSLFARASYKSHVFNYTNEYLNSGNSKFTDKQHDNIGDVSIGISPYSLGRFSIGAEASYLFFKQKYATTLDDANEENQFVAKASFRYDIKDNQALALGLGLRSMNYSMSDGNVFGYDFKNVLGFSFAPHYKYADDRLFLTLGLNGYAASGVENSFSIAPNISVDYYLSANTVLYLKATGGEIYNDFRHFCSITPYWVLTNSFSGSNMLPVQLPNQFDKLRALLGVRTKPVKDVFVNASVGYDISENRAEIIPLNSSSTDATIFAADGNRFYADFDLHYDYRDIVSIELKNRYNSWGKIEMQGELEKQKVLWRPILDLDWNVSWRVFSTLRLGVGYRFQTFNSTDDIMLFERPETNDLKAELSYTLPMGLTIYVKAMNILNQNYHAFYGVPSLGASFMGGVAITF